ncbi:unnamed protein product (macronuclear) [Paramecium tetraurelia]|uniref:Kinesin motor domain-containing protein n=1 Tax=Paramecium tetraurelia TaxID=5888 RepID=A0C961_PARTE|nr:uncharacterized protein GSPATT00006634001 [Paramecium tetraurelia]CAK67328.1 unnamed protein product [Paramecium tetraurelia]|eukprot:XP_001434725.1 hypothetical protein (macronuclear) [Paramecium tetraurelia strain d4-2]
MTRSIIPSGQANERVDTNQQDANVIIVCKPLNLALKSSLKGDKKGNQQKLKVLRFAQPVKQTYIVENWKKYNHSFEEEKETCCKLF